MDEILCSSLPCIGGVNKRKLKITGNFNSCKRSKAVQSPWKTLYLENHIASKPLDRVYLDVIGPVKVSSISNFKKFVTLLDVYSGYFLLRFVTPKGEVASAVKVVVRKLKILFNDLTHSA